MGRYAPALAACTLPAVLALRQRFVIINVNGDSMRS
jgi:hypothetical protein